MESSRIVEPGARRPAALAACACLLAAGGAHAQLTDLIYDDGTPANTLRDLAEGDIEVVRMTPEHPARLVSVHLYVATTGGCTLHAAVWPDGGGNDPDIDHPLWETDADVDAPGWVDLEPPEGEVVFDPPRHFYVGHVVGDDPCQLSWDDSGSAEPRSMARIGGNMYVIADDSGSLYLDALARATVEYFDVRTEFDFAEVSEEVGLPAGFGGRMAWGDYDDDGDDDLLLGGSRLFRNEGGTFEEVTEEAGIGGQPTNGAVWADYDNDGRLDFYATVSSYYRTCDDDADCVWCTIQSLPDGSYACDEYQHDHTCGDDGHCLPPSGTRPHDLLWHNEGDGTFAEVSEDAGNPWDYSPSEAAAWGDYDNDGYVDLYVANYEAPIEWTRGMLGYGTADRLWHNEGDGTFTEATAAAGMERTPQCGRGVNWADYDADGDLDLYVANYRLDANFFWLNNGDGTFTNVAADNGTAGINEGGGAYGHSIGAAWGDFDDDADWDLFVANLAHPRFIEFSDKSMLYESSGAPDFSFEDIREAAGITYSETHSNPAWGDYDNDGWIDLFITDVYVGYRSFLYRNDGDRTFTDATYPSGIVVDNGWGCAWADYDGDGKLDLAANGLWRNRTADAGHWLKVRVRGGPADNGAAIGAVVTVDLGDRTLMRQVEGGSGTGVQNSLTLHFGLGEESEADLVTLRCPVGRPATASAVAADRVLELECGGPDTGDDEQDAGDEGDGEGGEAADGGGEPDEDGDAADGPPGGGSGGCSCRWAGHGAGGRALAALLAAAAALVRRPGKRAARRGRRGAHGPVPT